MNGYNNLAALKGPTIQCDRTQGGWGWGGVGERGKEKEMNPGELGVRSQRA